MAETIRLGDLLVSAGVIDGAQLRAALAEQQKWGGKLGAHLVKMGFTDFWTISRALGKQFGLPAFNPRTEEVDLTLLKSVPQKFALEKHCLPVRRNERSIAVALANPADLMVCDDVEAMLSKKVEPVACCEQDLLELIDRAYRALEYGQEVLIPEHESAAPAEVRVGPTERQIDFDDDEEELPILQTENEQAAVDFDSWDDAPASPPPPAPPPSAAPPAPAAAPSPPPAKAPAPAQAAAATSQSGAASMNAGELRQVILYDRDPGVLREQRLALRREGYDVRETQQHDQVFQIITQFVPHVIVLEVSAEEMAGVAVAKKLKASNRFGNVPVLLTTDSFRGWRGCADLQELSGANAVLEKPVSNYDLLATIDGLLSAEGSAADRAAEAEAQRLLAEGQGHFELGEFDQAAVCFEQAVEFDEFLAPAYHALASVYERQKKIYKAIEAFEKAGELEPNNFIVFKNLSLIYEKLGFKRKCYEAFERSARCCPNPRVKDKIKAHLAKLID